MRIAAGQFKTPLRSDLTFASQMGVSGVTFNALDLDDYRNRQAAGLAMRPHGLLRDEWVFEDLARLNDWVEQFGLRIEALENVPHRMMHHIKCGTDQANRQIDAFCRTVENMGRAGIKVLGYNFSVLPVIRTDHAHPVRGGAKSMAYFASDLAHVPISDVVPTSADEIWERYRRFITRVLPVAESAGVTLALHPDDPPFPNLLGVDRILCTREDFDRALGLSSSPMHKLDFCAGTFAENGPESMYAMLEHFAVQSKIAYVHLRNIKAQGDGFAETFIDDGDYNVPVVFGTLLRHGFDGFIIDDHVPYMVGDTGWAHRGRAYATGYLKGMADAFLAASTS